MARIVMLLRFPMFLTRFIPLFVMLSACSLPQESLTTEENDDLICPSGQKIEFYELHDAPVSQSLSQVQDAETIVMGLRCVVDVKAH